MSGRVGSLLEVGTGFHPGVDRTREHLPQRRDSRHAPPRDRRQVRRDRRVLRGRGVHRYAGQALFERDVRPARVRGRRPSGAGDPARRRGARRRGRRVPAEVHRQDGRSRREGGQDDRVRLAQSWLGEVALRSSRAPRARRGRRRRVAGRRRFLLPPTGGAGAARRCFRVEGKRPPNRQRRGPAAPCHASQSRRDSQSKAFALESPSRSRSSTRWSDPYRSASFR